MRGTVIIDNKTVELKATASTFAKYRALFNRDLLKDFQTLRKAFKEDEEVTGDAVILIANLTYVMAKQANPDTVPNNVYDWLDQFEVFPIEDFATDVVTLLAASLNAKVELKNV